MASIVPGEGGVLEEPVETGPAFPRPPQKEGADLRFAPSDSRTDLTAVPILGPVLSRWLKSRRFQFSFILPSMILFWLVVIVGFLGTNEPTKNFATTITWYLWFAMMFPLTLLVGRAWCVTCPFGGFGEWIQRKTPWARKRTSLGLGWKMPKGIANYGLILSAVIFIGMTWAEEFFNIGGPGAPFMTSVMILSIISFSTVVFVLFERRTFCRYLCPLSSLIAVAGSTGIIAGFRPKDREGCLDCQTKECMRGGDRGYGCPWYTYPATADTNTYCGLCSECYKACPYDNIGVYAQKPFTSVIAPAKRTSMAWVIAMLFGLVIFQQWNATGSYTALDGWLNDLTHFPNYPNPIDYVLAIAAVVAILAGVSLLMSRTLSFKTAAARAFPGWFAPLMYGFIPLIGSDFLARVMPKFFNNVPKLVSVIAGVFGAHLDLADVKILPNDWLVRLQYLTVGLGIIAAMYTMSRITGKDLRDLAAHKTLSRVIPALIVVVVGAGIIALFAVMNGAE
jgi:NosR/NirI family transcriptional regulator, nitrous oxide reductase regulator